MELKEASASYLAPIELRIPEGYKQTEVGVIPKDWKVMTANQISTPVRGGSPRPAGDPRYFNGSYIPWLTVAALTNISESQLVVSETTTCLTEEGSLRSRTLAPGTLIIANSGATLGVAKILGVRCCANDGIAALLNLNRAISPRYLAHFINTKTKYLREVVATGNGQPNLNTDLIGDFKFPLPPTTAEQEAIADALSDADALIESLEQLITKRRQIKQGAMQELLTGKRRLPGFSGEWEVTTFGTVAERIVGGGTPSRGVASYWNGDIPWMTVKDFAQHNRMGTIEYITKEGLKNSASNLISRNTLIIATRMALGKAIIFDVDVTINQDLKAIFPTTANDVLFLYYWFQFNAGIFAEMGSGSTVMGLSLWDLKKIPFSKPWHAEQTAIAKILSDMDAEIASLEAKLAKARQIKQGMMQELLTGRIRLVENSQ